MTFISGGLGRHSQYLFMQFVYIGIAAKVGVHLIHFFEILSVVIAYISLLNCLVIYSRKVVPCRGYGCLFHNSLFISVGLELGVEVVF